ncbi:MAG: hypothetical protein JXB39_06570 [Deltaproteobacteria bacterium]|nr:hypothetical protein [Deltaproteobacteria bacterium]
MPEPKAIVLRTAVVDASGTPCEAPILILPRSQGRIAARVQVWQEDLALLQAVPGSAIPFGLDTLALPDPSSAARVRDRRVHVLGDLDAQGRVHERLATLEGLDPTNGTLSWLDPQGGEVSPGAPVVTDDGLLLGLLGQPGASGGPCFPSGVSARALVERVQDLPLPSPAHRTGIWIAHPPGPEGEAAYRDLVRSVRHELLKVGLDSATWEIRDLGCLPSGPPEAQIPVLRRRGATVRASVVLAVGAPGVPSPLLLIDMERPPRWDGASTLERALTAARRGEALLLPAAVGDVQLLSRAAAASVVLHRTAASGGTSPHQTTIRRAVRDAHHLVRRIASWHTTAARTGSDAADPARRALASAHVLEGDLLLRRSRAGSSGSRGVRSPPPPYARDALEAFTEAAALLDPGRDPEAWRDTWDRVARTWVARTDVHPAVRRKAVLDALRSAQASSAPSGREEACRDLARARLILEVSGRGRESTRAQARDLLAQAEKVLDRSVSPLCWAVGRSDHAAILQGLPATDRPARCREVIQAATEALAVLRPDLLPLEWARTRNTVGEALVLDPSGERATNVRLAIHAHEGALDVLDDAPFERARTLNLLGSALQAVPDRERPAALARAVAAHREALSVFRLEVWPVAWATTYRLLARAERALPDDEGLAFLDSAVTTCRQALEVLDRHDAPEAWAWTQVTLGDALVADPRGEPDLRLQEALAAYNAALWVADPVTMVEVWGEATSGLGRVWRALPGGDRQDHLHRAEAAFQAALEVRTREADPAAWERLQGELAVTRAWHLALDAARESPGSALAASLEGDACLQEALLPGGQPTSTAGRRLLARAEAAYTRALEIDAQDTDALEGLALVRWYAQDAMGAAEAALRLSVLLPQDPVVADSLRLYQWRARVAEDPEDLEAWAALAARDLAEGRPGDALDDWARVLAVRPADPEALAGSVRVLAERQDTDGAKTLVERALATAPEDPAVLEVAVWVFLEVAPDPARAEAAARPRAAALPRHLGAAADLATALLLLRRGPEALAVLEPLVPRLRSAPAADVVRICALRLAAGAIHPALARDLRRAYGALARGTTVPGPWDLVRHAALHDLPPPRRAAVDRVIGVLALPCDARSQETLHRALSAL